MPDTTLAHDLMLQLLVMLGLGALACWCAEKTSISRTAGGLLAGMLLGPVLANTLPKPHTDLFHGTAPLQAELERAEQALEEDRLELSRRINGLKASGVTEEYWQDALQSGQAQLESQKVETVDPIRHAIAATAGLRHQGRLVMLVVAAALVFFSAGASAQLGATPKPAAAALGSIVAAVLGCLLLGVLFEDLPWLAAAAAAIGCAAVALPLEPRLGQTLDTTETQLVGVSGTWATLIASVAAVALVATARHDPLGAGLCLAVAMGLTALAMVVGLRFGPTHEPWVLPVVVAVLAAAIIGPAWALWAALVGGVLLGRSRGEVSEPGILWRLAEPVVLVYAGMRLEPALMGNGWLCLLLVIVFSDLRAGGATLALKLGGESWSRSLAVGTAMIRGGAANLVIAIGLLETGLIGADVFGGLVLANFLTALLAAPMLGWFKKWCAESPTPPAEAG